MSITRKLVGDDLFKFHPSFSALLYISTVCVCQTHFLLVKQNRTAIDHLGITDDDDKMSFDYCLMS